MTGLRGARWTGIGGRRVTPVKAASQEARLELSGGVRSPMQEPRWNADRRARSAERAPHPKMRRLVLRLSAFCLPSLQREEKSKWRVVDSEAAFSQFAPRHG